MKGRLTKKMRKKKAGRLVAQGDVRRGVRELTTHGLAPLTDDIKAQLQAKHPQRQSKISLPTDAELQVLKDAIQFDDSPAAEPSQHDTSGLEAALEADDAPPIAPDPAPGTEPEVI